MIRNMSNKAATAGPIPEGLAATSSAALATIIEAIPDPAALFTLDGLVLRANARFRQCFDWYRQGEGTTVPSDRWFSNPPDDFPKFTQLLRRAGETDAPAHPVSVSLNAANAEQILTEIRACGIRDGHDKRRTIVVVFKDITRQHTLARQVDEYERRHKEWLQISTEMIFGLDVQGQLLFVNETWERRVGFREEEVKGTDVLNLVCPEFHEDVRAALARLAQGRTIENLQFQSRTRDGRTIDILANLRPTRDAGGNVVQILGAGRDITERKKAEETLEKLNRNLQSAVSELERSNRELRDFAHVTAHDLKAPLRGITMLANWISQDCAETLDEHQQENLHLLQNRADKMTRLIEGILHYSEIGHREGSLERVDANALAREVIEQLVPPDHIEIRLENTLPVVPCEKTRLTQVLQNLISNAIKYIDKPDGKVRIAAVEKEDCWVFRVADNGPGIETQHFERIFKMFQTLSSSESGENTGLGLAVVKKIVEIHGGRVWVESETGRGSTFYFSLPKHPAQSADR